MNAAGVFIPRRFCVAFVLRLETESDCHLHITILSPCSVFQFPRLFVDMLFAACCLPAMTMSHEALLPSTTPFMFGKAFYLFE